jgi:antitoxin component YwqK of YwqJK toxin-antitoxin module
VQNWSHDDRVTVVEPREEIYPGKTYKRPDTPKVNSDSLIFYKEYENNPAEASTIEIRKAYPEKGFRETTWYDKGRKTKSITEFFKPSGILYIEKEYYSNGKVKSEKMVEKSVYHFVTYSKSGKVLTKDYNLPLQK